jgi:type II secretory pathway component GspD/PulD (secretin)
MAGNRLVVRANPKMKREILQVIEAIDKPALQVMLEAKLVEVSIDALARLGIDWDKINSITTIVAEAGKAQLPPGFPGAIDTDEIPDEMRFERTKGLKIKDMDWSRQLEAFEIVLDLLINDGTARILADTKLATMNNRDATIHIGDIVPYMVTSFAAGTGGVTEMVTIEREKVGIKLRITPQVNEDGYIITRVEPEVSSIIGFVGPNDEIPWVKTRSASTTVRVKDGETIIIAGLLATDETTQISKLPLLGDIPYLGKLFQHTTEKKRKTDLIIEITPQIIKG